jgi:hypothetical protein
MLGNTILVRTIQTLFNYWFRIWSFTFNSFFEAVLSAFMAGGALPGLAICLMLSGVKVIRPWLAISPPGTPSCLNMASIPPGAPPGGCGGLLRKAS